MVQRTRECILYFVLLEWCLHSVCVVLAPTVNSADRSAHGFLPLVLCSVLCTCVNLRYQMARSDARGISPPRVRTLCDMCCTYGTTLCLLFSLVSSAQLLLLLLLVELFALCDSGYGFVYHFFTLVYLTRATGFSYSNVCMYEVRRTQNWASVG